MTSKLDPMPGERRISVVCSCDSAKAPKRIALVGLAFGYDASTRGQEPYAVQLKGPEPQRRWMADTDRRNFLGPIDEEDVGGAVVENLQRYRYRCGRCGRTMTLLQDAWDAIFVRLLVETVHTELELRDVALLAQRQRR